MDGNITATEGAPISTGAETSPTVIATAPRKRSARKPVATTIARRKVLTGKHKMTGAPKLPVIGLTQNPRRGAFTLQDIFQANGETISLLTIKKRKNDLLEAGKLVKMARDFKQHEGSGRPPEYFNFDLTKGVVKTKKVRTRKVKAIVAPVVAAEAPVVEPVYVDAFTDLGLPAAPVEQPAEVVAV